MYLREKKILLLRIRNVLLSIFCVVELLGRGFYVISEFVYYRDDPESAWGAVDMKSSLIMLPIVTVLLILVGISRSRIGNAVFYSSCFEGDLDGYLHYADLAAVTGKTLRQVRRELRFCRRHYMQRFEIKPQPDGTEIIELYSKKALCECKSCGAHIEKRVFFTGTCPYCDSSDLTARVLTGDRFYSISNTVQEGTNNPSYYKAKLLTAKKALFAVLFVLGAFLALIGLLMSLTEIPHLFDMEYQKQMLFDATNHLNSYELIRAHILDGIIFAATLFVVFTPLAVLRFRKMTRLAAAEKCAVFFSRYRVPYVQVDAIPNIGTLESSSGRMKKIRGAIRHGYLKNCTFEMHGGKLTAALAKKIVKDQCPGCGAPLTGAVDENCVCSYCGKEIMGVIVKK